MTEKRGPKRNGATIKQRKFVKKLLETGNQREAAMQAYNSKSRHNAGQIAKQMLGSPNVQQYLKQCLEASGLGIEGSTSILHEIIEDNKRGKPSQAVRLGAITQVLRLQDAYPATKTLNASLNLSSKTSPSDMSALTKALQQTVEINQKLLQELQK